MGRRHRLARIHRRGQRRAAACSAPDADGIRRIQAKHAFLKTLTVPAGSYPGQREPIVSVGSWSFIMARPSLGEDAAIASPARCTPAHAALAARLPQAAETTAANTLAAAP